MDLRGYLNVIYAFQSIIKTLLSFQRKFESINLSRVIYEMSSVGAPDTFLTHKEHISNLRLVEEEELHQDRDLLLIIDKISRWLPLTELLVIDQDQYHPLIIMFALDLTLSSLLIRWDISVRIESEMKSLTNY